MNHTEEQLAYFASIDHAERFRWQTEDAFVKAREFETLRPFADRLQELHAQKGRPLTVLESGCGEGVNIIHLRQLGVSETDVAFTGIDMSPEAVAEAQRHALDVRVGDGLHLPFPDGSFDVAFCRDVFHHLESDADRSAFFQEMRRVVRSGGCVAAIEPNPLNGMIFGLSVAIPQERGLRRISEGRMKSLFPGAIVHRAAPSAAWRFWLHFYSPLRRIVGIKVIVQGVLATWGTFCRVAMPSALWSYRVYIWEVNQ